jgi:two-component system response regulator HydG
MSRVLLVDDDADALEIRTRIFENHGHLVTAANTASRAREQFRAAPFDNVILDLRLPQAEDGLALVRELRAESQQLKIVVLSGWIADIEGRSESAMVDLILSKPVRSEVLLSAVSTNNQFGPASPTTPENTPATPRASSQETESFAPQAEPQAARK